MYLEQKKKKKKKKKKEKINVYTPVCPSFTISENGV